MGERKLEYKDSKGQDCYFYYSNIAGTDLDMPFYVCNAECVSGMKKRESKSETFSANPFEYEFLYAPLGDKGAYAYQQPWYGFSVNKDSEEKEITKPRPAQTVSDARGGVLYYWFSGSAADRTNYLYRSTSLVRWA